MIEHNRDQKVHSSYSFDFLMCEVNFVLNSIAGSKGGGKNAYIYLDSDLGVADNSLSHNWPSLGGRSHINDPFCA